MRSRAPPGWTADDHPTNGTLITAYVDGVPAGTGPVSNGRLRRCR